MIFKNLLRYKGRSVLTILAISIGVAAIVGLGALANGLEAGYDSFLSGSKADFIISQPDAIDVSMSTVDEAVGVELESMSEILQVSGMLQGLVQADEIPIFFVFGYPADSFILGRFAIISGVPLHSRDAQYVRGKPVLLGTQSAEAMNKQVGDSLHIQESTFRIVGIYETGSTLEDNGAVIPLKDAQELLGRLHQVSIFYLQLKDAEFAERVIHRVERQWPDLTISSSKDFADKQIMGEYAQAFVWAIAGFAIIIGGVGMMNSQLMSVIERTREIGVLRSVGWSKYRVMAMTLGEALLVGLMGGVMGIFIAWCLLTGFKDLAGFFGASSANITPDLIQQAFLVVIILSIIGGAYPAWRASRMPPVEALRYEGGTSGENVRRLPFGGMAVQSLWQRITRTFLTFGAIGIAVGGIIALEATVNGMLDTFSKMGGDAEIIVRQAGVADTEYSAVDERIGDKIAALSDVAFASGMSFAATILPDSSTIFMIIGYAPNEYKVQRVNLIEGERITGNHQVMLGRMMSESLKLGIGDNIELGGSRYKITGIYESSLSWEEMGGIFSQRDVQAYLGRPRKVSLYMIKVKDPSSAPALVEKINRKFPEVHASLSGEFVSQMPDIKNVNALLGSISFLAILVGGVGVLNTMLMAVLERTREIGVLRALGWQRRRILRLIITEAMLLGIIGGLLGIVIALVLAQAFNLVPIFRGILQARWDLPIFIRAVSVALMLGFLGGLYPAFRATRLQPVEALRYE